MDQDGLIWKNGIYVHVCFAEGWYAEIHPWSVKGGHEFKTVCSVGFLTELSDDGFTNARLSQEPSLGRTFDRFKNLPKQLQLQAWRISGEFPERYDLLPATNDFYLYTLMRYQNTVRPLIHGIATVYDAYRFIKEYRFMHAPVPSTLAYILIDELIVMNRLDEALQLVKDLRINLNSARDNYRKTLDRILSELRSLDERRYAERNDSEVAYNQILTMQRSSIEQGMEQQQLAANRLSLLDSEIRTCEYSNHLAAYIKKRETASARLIRCFTEKELRIMTEKWC